MLSIFSENALKALEKYKKDYVKSQKFIVNY